MHGTCRSLGEITTSIWYAIGIDIAICYCVYVCEFVERSGRHSRVRIDEPTMTMTPMKTTKVITSQWNWNQIGRRSGNSCLAHAHRSHIGNFLSFIAACVMNVCHEIICLMFEMYSSNWLWRRKRRRWRRRKASALCELRIVSKQIRLERSILEQVPSWLLLWNNNNNDTHTHTHTTT